MKWSTLDEGIGIAVEALRANKVRSGLTILGVGIGVGVVVTMAALITGIRSSILEAFEAAGPDNFTVMPFDFSEVRLMSSRPPWWDKPEITHEEIRRISALPGVGEAVVDFDFEVTLTYEGDEVRLMASGDSEGWTAYMIGDFVAGRNFIDAEVRNARPVVVITQALAEELFGQSDPIGKRIRATTGRRGVNELFEVVGVFDLGDNIFGEAADHFAVFPWTSAEKRLKARDEWNFTAVAIIPDPDHTREEVQDQVISSLRSMRGLRPGEPNNFALVESAQLIELFNQLTGVFFIVMLALSSVGLLVGGVGVIGIMMISVTERTREIGVRKSVGATRREILWQFLVEAAVLTTVGGAAGLLLGWGLSEVVEAYTPIPASIPLWSVFAALAMALLTGVLFGLIPAVRGSRLDPVAALRYE